VSSASVRGGVTRLVLALLAACAWAQPQPTAERPLVLHVSPAGASVRLVLLAAPGWKINARVKPVVETADGRRLRLEALRLTPDSAYFAEPPSALVASRSGGIRGTLRASVCAAGEAVCRLMTLDVRSER
jgi:hypothetical protein